MPISRAWPSGRSKVTRRDAAVSSAKSTRPLPSSQPSRTVPPPSTVTLIGRITLSARGKSTFRWSTAVAAPSSMSSQGLFSSGSGYQTVPSSSSSAPRPMAAGCWTAVEEPVTCGNPLARLAAFSASRGSVRTTSPEI